MPEIWELQNKPAYGGTIVDAGVHPEDGSSLVIELTPDEGTQYLSYYLSEKAFKRGKALGVNFADDHWPLLIAEYDFPTRLLTTYPIWLRSNQSNFTKTKYGSIKRISFEDQPPMDFQVGFGIFFDLPTGFHRGPFEGFGIDPRIRYIISAFNEVEGAAGLTICNDDEISIDGEEIRLPEHIYHDVRLDINRAHEAAVRFANGEKVSYLRNRLLPSVVSDFKPDDFERPAVDLLRLIKGIAAKKEEDDQPHIQAWSVPCILIIGRLPETHDLKRSFEIYRGSQRDVLIITFDELLAKLKALHEFLSTKPDEPEEDLSDQFADLL